MPVGQGGFSKECAGRSVDNTTKPFGLRVSPAVTRSDVMQSTVLRRETSTLRPQASRPTLLYFVSVGKPARRALSREGFWRHSNFQLLWLVTRVPTLNAVVLSGGIKTMDEWREEGLQLPQRHKQRKRLYHKDSWITRLRPTDPNHVWAIHCPLMRICDAPAAVEQAKCKAICREGTSCTTSSATGGATRC